MFSFLLDLVSFSFLFFIRIGLFWENHFSQTAANSIRGWLYGERAKRIQASYIWKCPKSHDSNSRSNGRDRAYFYQRRVEHQGNTMLWETTQKRGVFSGAFRQTKASARRIQGARKTRAKERKFHHDSVRLEVQIKRRFL